ncbi:MAG: monovalent cation/H+ antiporter complex subunit F [Verrucomicrobiota bacterium]
MFSDIIPIPEWVIFVIQLILGIAMLLCVIRIIMGPSLMDRIVGLDLLAALIMAQIVTLVLVTGFLSFLNVAVAIAVISFIATVALARYLEQSDDSES